PALADMNGDGVLDIVVSNLNNDLWAITGAGQILFHQRPCNKFRPDVPCAMYSTPAIGDLDRDGRPDIVVASVDHNLYAYRMDGSLIPGFPVFLMDTTWSTPALADIDKDGWLEVVVGADMDVGSPCCPYGGELWVVRHDGARQPGFPRNVPGEIIMSSPAVVDMDGDGWPDITFGAGLFFVNTGRPGGASRLVHSMDRFGNERPGWPVT